MGAVGDVWADAGVVSWAAVVEQASGEGEVVVVVTALAVLGMVAGTWPHLMALSAAAQP